ncbi:MAG: 2-hydroxyacid dehydrogenase [Gaiella sp.]
MARVVVTREIPHDAIEALEAVHDVWVSPHDRPLDLEELYDAVTGADAVVALLHDRIDGAFLAAAGKNLKVVANVAVGYNNIDVEACRARGVVATNTPGVLTDATADIAFALILMSTRRLGEAERMVRRGLRWSWNMFFHLGMGIQGKTLGIVGLGQIGTATARRGQAFGMKIAYAGRRRAERAVEDELGARFLELDELFATCDVISLHCPLDAATRHLVDARRLALMQPHAYLVNTTRGPVVDEAALVDALRDGRLGGAGLDVYENEPEIHPGLLELENVVLLPHLGSSTVETRREMALLAARNVLAVLAGEQPPTPIT